MASGGKRFISKFPNYRKVAVHQKVEVLASGQPRILSDGFTCEFVKGDVTDRERDEARRIFTWAGVPTNQDGSPLDPIDDLHRISSFDTTTIGDPDLRALVEKVLLDSQSVESHILIEAAQIPLPYASYGQHRRVQGRRTLEHAIADITEAVNVAGVNPEAVIAYERQHQNSPEIISAMGALLETEPQPEGDLVTA